MSDQPKPITKKKPPVKMHLIGDQPKPKPTGRGRECYPGIIHAVGDDGNCLICQPKPEDKGEWTVRHGEGMKRVVSLLVGVKCLLRVGAKIKERDLQTLADAHNAAIAAAEHKWNLARLTDIKEVTDKAARQLAAEKVQTQVWRKQAEGYCDDADKARQQLAAERKKLQTLVEALKECFPTSTWISN